MGLSFHHWPYVLAKVGNILVSADVRGGVKSSVFEIRWLVSFDLDKLEGGCELRATAQDVPVTHTPLLSS